MADAFYVSIVGRQQGKFHAEGAGAGSGKIKGLAFHYEVTAPRDSASGQASGRRQHSPVTFVKEWGASSPQLLTAALNYELLTSVLFEFVETNLDGEEAVFHTIKLTNASVASIKQDAKAIAGGHDLQDLEEVSIVFQSIEMENLNAHTTAVDSWGAKGSRTSGKFDSGQILVQEPYAGLEAGQASADKMSAPRVLLSRAPSAGG